MNLPPDKIYSRGPVTEGCITNAYQCIIPNNIQRNFTSLLTSLSLGSCNAFATSGSLAVSEGSQVQLQLLTKYLLTPSNSGAVILFIVFAAPSG